MSSLFNFRKWLAQLTNRFATNRFATYRFATYRLFVISKPTGIIVDIELREISIRRDGVPICLASFVQVELAKLVSSLFVHGAKIMLFSYSAKHFLSFFTCVNT